jgi:hypothetical protein
MKQNLLGLLEDISIIKVGQKLFYRDEKVFGTIIHGTVDGYFKVRWHFSDREMDLQYLFDDVRYRSDSWLLNDCILCENEQDVIAVSLKYL